MAEEMGYVPDVMAQSLRTRRTRLFGVVVPNVTHPVLSQATVALQDSAFESGYDIILAQTQDSPQREEAALRRLLARRIDGLFLYPVYRLAPTAPIYEELIRSRTPTVLLGTRSSFCSQLTAIETENSEASFELTRHLLGLGHRRIAFFTGPPSMPDAQERFDGYRRALRDARITLDDRLVFAAGSSVEDGEKAALQMLNEATDATAVQATSDFVAMGAASILLKQGLRIPQDISLAGFGDYFGADHFRVALTTVRQPRAMIGSAAAECMFRLLRGEKVEPRRLAAPVIIRDSTGKPNPRRAQLR
jgi:LacI family transcriptional regulator